jgi:hypothetical protein
MRLLPSAAFLLIALVLAAALAQVGSNLNLPAPVIGTLSPVGRPPPFRPARPARPARVLLVVIDGLRADVARSLPFLAELAKVGGRARLWADPPTYSTAQYVALLTGVPPRDSGVRTNATIRPAGVDDVARSARDAGLRTAVVSTQVDWWQRLFPGSFAEARVVPAGSLLAQTERLVSAESAKSAKSARSEGADFLVVHLCEVDDAGHRFGARSPQYAEAARVADHMTESLARAWGWPGANVVVTADHGHRDRGGHGGAEPEVRESFLVAAGPDVERGANIAEARSIDMAPTLAAWLGVIPPAQASGRTLVELLRATSETRAAIVAADDQRRMRVAAASSEARRVAGRAEVRSRIVRGALALPVLAFAVWLGRRRPRAILRGLLGLGVTIGLFTAMFGPISFSAARRAVVWGLSLGLLAFTAAAIAAGLGARRREGPLGTAAVVAGFSPPAIAAFVHSGLFATRLTCEPAWIAAGPAFAYALLVSACAAAALITFGERRAAPN